MINIIYIYIFVNKYISNKRQIYKLYIFDIIIKTMF